jgi:hypothetical protein
MQAIELAYHNLANAIILQAVADYREALRGTSYNPHRSPESIIKEIEKFFRSDYFEYLTKIKGEYLLDRLKKEYQEERKSYES